MIEPTYIYRALLLRTIDGDTIVADIDLGFRIMVSTHLRIRGVNTPERGQPGFVEATEFTRSHLAGSSFMVQTSKDQQTFARWVADVYLFTGESLAELLIANGHGVKA